MLVCVNLSEQNSLQNCFAATPRLKNAGVQPSINSFIVPYYALGSVTPTCP